MRRLILALPVVLLPVVLAACAQGPTLEQRLSTFIGQREGDLVAGLGVPVRTYEADGRRFLQFERQSTAVVPGDPWGYGWYGMRRPWAVPSTYVPVRCDITFVLREGRAESFTLRGEGCG